MGRTGSPVTTEALYRYRAARRDGSMEIGILAAPNRAAAGSVLSARGLFAVEIAPQTAATVRRGHIPVRDLALGLRVLANLLDAGLPIARSLALLEDLAPPTWCRLLPQVRERIRAGDGLARAIETARADVPAIVLGVLHAGEAGGGLASAVRRAAELMEERAAMRAALAGALAYPALLASAGALSIVFLVGFVLPRFATLLGDLGQALPPSTRIVLGAAEIVRAGAVPAACALIAVWGAWAHWVTSAEGRRRWHAALLRAPLLGRLRLGAATARVAAALAALLGAGVPIAGALQHAATAAGDAAVAARLLDARERVLHGCRLSQALLDARACTPTVARLARAGEETGRLGVMFGHAATIERERVNAAVRALVRVIEPALVVTFGAVIALVAAALLQAVYSVRPA